MHPMQHNKWKKGGERATTLCPEKHMFQFSANETMIQMKVMKVIGNVKSMMNK
jgi:hypothetical protein